MGGVEVGVYLGDGLDGVQELVVLGVYGVGVDLVEHAVQHCLDRAPGVSGAGTHQGPCSGPNANVGIVGRA